MIKRAAWLMMASPLVCLGAFAGQGPTISTHPSISPSGHSLSYTNWFTNAVAAVQRGVTRTGNPATDPTAFAERNTYRYSEVIETVDPDPRIDLGFSSWLGIADPTGAASKEGNGMLAVVGRILGNGTKIKLSNVRYSWTDDGGAWSITNSRPHVIYGLGMYGVDYGPDGKLGGSDDVIYQNGAPATNLVDEIVYVPGNGGFYYGKTFDFGTTPVGLSHQGLINWADDFITKNDGYAPSNTMGFYLFDDSGSLVTSATVQYRIVDQPTLYIAKSGNEVTLMWAGLGFTLENSATLGPTAAWTAVPNATESPVKVSVGGGSAGFYRLHK